jgi:cobalt-zinc-cadmium resistance protein CzcA
VGEIRIIPNRSALARYGLTTEDLQMATDAAAAGVPVTEFLEGQRRYPVVLRYPAAYRAGSQRLEGITLTAPGGEQLRLSEIASVALTRGAEAIQRENGLKRIVVQFNVRGRDLGSVVAEAQQRLDQSLKLPAGYFTDWGGQFKNQARATARLAIVLPLSLLLIITLLYATFRSLGQSFLILTGIPLSSIGGIAMLWARDLNLNLSASIGFIALFGVAVLNGIVLVATINQLGDIPRACVQRFRPVMMTALVAALGFVPMAFSSTPGSEVQRPLASVVVGGILSNTVLTLFVLPALYPWFSASRKSDQTT